MSIESKMCWWAEKFAHFHEVGWKTNTMSCTFKELASKVESLRGDASLWDAKGQRPPCCCNFVQTLHKNRCRPACGAFCHLRVLKSSSFMCSVLEFMILVFYIQDSPCSHHGSCSPLMDSYSCSCTQGWSGPHCQERWVVSGWKRSTEPKKYIFA